MSRQPRNHRFVLMLNDDELKAIDDYRFENRIPTRARAVRQLCIAALRSDAINSIRQRVMLADVEIIASGEAK